ncbi:MAG TPA: hypothetical protein PK124_07480 [Bacteroidales bacterium]|nr:hypothetical protein [Bacteroidales bacterium]
MKKNLLIILILFSAVFAKAQWQQIDGFYGGRIECLAVSGTNIFAGTLGGELFLSTDNGSNWTATNNDVTTNYVRCFAVSGTNIFAGTLRGGIFLSTDNGNNWTAVNNGLTSMRVSDLAVSGTNM